MITIHATINLNLPTDVLNVITERLASIMSTQAEQTAALVAKLDALTASAEATGTKLDKISAETSGLLDVIKNLVEQGTPLDPVLLAAADRAQAAVDSLAPKADAVDALVDDTPPSPL